jgi:peroxiredoxin
MNRDWWGYLIFLSLISMQAGSAELKVGDPVPECALMTEKQAPFLLSGLKAKAIYIDFWASWCSSCGQSFPFMNDLQRRFGGQGLKVLAINVDEKRREATDFLGHHKVEVQTAFDDSKDCAAAFGVVAMPATFVIGEDKRIQWIHHGFKRTETAEAVQAIEGLLSR